jgi:UDP-N-acetyl-2-amino-2-deoxyglucuronate dehydrogenase
MQRVGEQRLGVAVIGCGGVGGRAVGHYLAAPECSRVVAHDISEDRARRCAKKHRGAEWSTDFAAVLADPSVNVLDISTPNYLHAEQAVAALRAGKHVLVQKPMAVDVDQCEAMVAAADETRRTLGVYMSGLEEPLFRDIRALVHGGYLGRVCSARFRAAHLGRFRFRNDRENWRASLARTGGGSLIQLGIHGVNLLQWLLASEVRAVAAFSAKLVRGSEVGGDDLTHAVLEFGNGAQGTVDTSYCTEGCAVELYGTGGHVVKYDEMLRVKLDRPFAGEVLRCGPGCDTEQVVSVAAVAGDEALRTRYCQHVSFLRSVLEGGEPEVPGHMGLRDMRIVAAIYEAARSGRTVTTGGRLCGAG